MNRHLPIVVGVALLTSLGPWDLGVRVSASGDARQIVAEAQRRSEAKSQRYEGLLRSHEASGKVTEKRWTLERLGSHGQSKSVIRFVTPAEVKGVALLVVNHTDRASDQWMWTPAIERDRRIANQDRSTRFFGTDFSFEDLEERDVDQFSYELLGEDVIDGVACWKVQTTPKETKTSQYTSSVVWIRKDNYASARLESYIKEQPVRRLNYGDLRNLQGIWTAHVLTMTDLKRGSHTTLTLERVQYNVDLQEGNFTLQAIRR
ncbi:MAG: outer membrane lipoprotein-sorting protein [Vicinamibacterales bacterium]